jgi:DeoR family glycerol-3-phosphate regulon repressor|nr:DeoR family transcriptional regulator [Pseudodesulfovibrio senegalensis]
MSMSKKTPESKKTNQTPQKDPPLSKRHAEILELARKQGFVSVEFLANRFSVTPQTVRRDINRLVKQELLQRYHGGAGLPTTVENLAYTDRKVLHRRGKKSLARLLARHIPDNASLFIDIGTTAEECAKALSSHKGLRIVTNNLNVAFILKDRKDFEIMVAGGTMRGRDMGLTGETTLEYFDSFRVDYGILTLSGIDESGHLLDFDIHEAHISRTIIANATRTLLAADHSKFGRTAMARIGHITQVDALFTDKNPNEREQKLLHEAGVALHIADMKKE